MARLRVEPLIRRIRELAPAGADAHSLPLEAAQAFQRVIRAATEPNDGKAEPELEAALVALGAQVVGWAAAECGETVAHVAAEALAEARQMRIAPADPGEALLEWRGLLSERMNAVMGQHSFDTDGPADQLADDLIRVAAAVIGWLDFLPG